jgi:N-acetylglucosaminyl-diphospho-decaprenol L-rhamnosyltransferase
MINGYPFDLSIITISTNQRTLLEACLRSVYSHPTDVRFEVIVVDNVCTDSTSDMVQAHFPQANLVHNKRRLGYAANNNLGLRLARGRYPLILNPDIEVLSGAFDALVSFMDAESGVGLAGPKLFNSDMGLQYSCRRFSTPAHLLIRGLHLDKLMANSHTIRDAMYLDWDHNDVRDVDYVTGACMIVRREALAEVRPMDEGFELYFEDQDWCYRMWQRNWRVAYVPSSQMIHHHQRASARGLVSKSKRTHIRSMLRFFGKHYLPPTLRIAGKEPAWDSR